MFSMMQTISHNLVFLHMIVPYLARWAGRDAWPGPTAPIPGQMSHPAPGVTRMTHLGVLIKKKGIEMQLKKIRKSSLVNRDSGQ